MRWEISILLNEATKLNLNDVAGHVDQTSTHLIWIKFCHLLEKNEQIYLTPLVVYGKHLRIQNIWELLSTNVVT